VRGDGGGRELIANRFEFHGLPTFLKVSGVSTGVLYWQVIGENRGVLHGFLRGLCIP
jgi:hypothetical protein